MGSGGTLPTMSGKFVGTGSLVTVDVGFRPKLVKLVNLTDPAEGTWIDSMADGTALAGTDTFAAVSSNGITPTETGFTVGTDANFNTSGETVYWVAFG